MNELYVVDRQTIFCPVGGGRPGWGPTGGHPARADSVGGPMLSAHDRREIVHCSSGGGLAEQCAVSSSLSGAPSFR